MRPAEPRSFKVLVVEDEPLIAMIIEDVIEDLGWETIGPVSTLHEALALAASAELDCAVLDVNIRGGHVYPAAELLLARGVPFLLASGYADWTAPGCLEGAPRLSKPFTTAQVTDALRTLANRVAPA